MITIEIMGGLGNQLFQIFALLSHGIKSNHKIYFENIGSNNPDRTRYWNTFLKELSPLLKEVTPLPILREPNFNYNEIPNIKESFKLYGYFQSYKYFVDYETMIYEKIQLKKEKEKVKINGGDKVSLHFRIGDYKGLPDYHPILNINYYIKAIETLIKETKKEDWILLYFYEQQDDKLVKENIEIIKLKFNNLTFEPIDHKYKDYEQLLIMSQCEHNIIANSTFSWWGAYLNENQNKKVYYPSIWFGSKLRDKNTKDMFPKNWSKI